MKKQIKPDFHLPTRIYVSPDSIQNIGAIAAMFGSRVILVTTRSDFETYGNTIEQMVLSIKDADLSCIVYDEIPHAPTTEDIDTAATYIKKTNCNVIIGFGGIDSISAARALCILVSNYIFCHDLLATPRLDARPVNFITVPAYPMMGFEISPLFIVDEIHGLTKKIYFNSELYPHATIIDPRISLMTPDEKFLKMTVASLAIAAEQIISRDNNDIINTYSLKSVDMIFRNLPVCYRDSQNVTPRQFLSLASAMSGIAFSTSYLSLTMAISLALASRSRVDIESLMCVILPHIMEFNLTSSPGKYVQMSKVMGEDVRDITVIEAAIKAVEAIRKLESDVDIPQRLSNYDISKSVFKEVADLTMGYPFIRNTPRELNVSEIETILIAAY